EMLSSTIPANTHRISRIIIPRFEFPRAPAARQNSPSAHMESIFTNLSIRISPQAGNCPPPTSPATILMPLQGPVNCTTSACGKACTTSPDPAALSFGPHHRGFHLAFECLCKLRHVRHRPKCAEAVDRVYVCLCNQ